MAREPVLWVLFMMGGTVHRMSRQNLAYRITDNQARELEDFIQRTRELRERPER